MTKKKETKEEVKKVDPFEQTVKSLKANYQLARIDLMAQFQNNIIGVINTSGLFSQEVYLVLNILADATKGNFIQALLDKQKQE